MTLDQNNSCVLTKPGGWGGGTPGSAKTRLGCNNKIQIMLGISMNRTAVKVKHIQIG